MGLLDWIFGGCEEGHHKYEARYDESFPPGFPEGKKLQSSGLVETVSDMIQAMKVRTYVRDVCVRCGDVVERDKK